MLIVGASPVGGIVYLLAQRLRKRAPEPLTMRPRATPGSKAWRGPAGWGYSRSSPSPAGHAVGVVVIAGAAYLALRGQILAAAAITVVLVVIAFLGSTPPG